MLVNGRVWPYFEVEPKRYRFRVLNGCDSRTLLLHFEDPDIKVYQIGSDAGLLPRVVDVSLGVCRVSCLCPSLSLSTTG